jgi:hypothetical protein
MSSRVRPAGESAIEEKRPPTAGSAAPCELRALHAWLSDHPGQGRYLERFVYFGSSDDREFELFKSLHRSVKRSWGGVDLLTSVAGGMFCLNLAVRLRPQRIWIFDRNPLQLLLFDLVKRVVLRSADGNDFLRRLRERDYEADSGWEARLQESLAAKVHTDEGGAQAKGVRGFSRRPLERTWRYALNRFDRLKATLGSTPQQLWFEDIGNESFVDLLLRERKHWLYLSNIWELPARLSDPTLEEWVPGHGLEETDTILTYSRPFRAMIRRQTADG